MSGLEVGAIVPAIVSAAVGIYQVYRDWQKRKEERKSETQNQALQRLLSGNGAAIQKEYDRDRRRLGDIFERGDDIILNTLKDVLIQLQAIRITQLSGRRHDDDSRVIHPCHASIIKDSKSARDDTITALAQHYQRLAQASPIERPRALTSAPRSSGYNCPGQLTWTPIENYNWIVSLRCEVCNWYASAKENGKKYITKDGRVLDERVQMFPLQ
ncbi:hypothetical protein DL768_007769 [Monosporascus sp. mg162]|nr:hypothetical protein DL768_007769 [Monosporascus sp. mg162]